MNPLLQHLDRLPPLLVYAIALGSGKTYAGLGEASGLPMRTFTKIAKCQSWGTDNAVMQISVAQMGSFCAACEVDIIDQRKALRQLRDPKFWAKAKATLKPVQVERFMRGMAELKAQQS